MAGWEDLDKERPTALSFFMQGMRALWHLLENERKRIILVAALAILVSLFQLLPPYLMKLIMDQIQEMLAEGRVGAMFFALAAGALAVTAVGLYVRYLVKEVQSIKTIKKIENHVPVIAQKKLLTLSLPYHETENTGQKISKINKGCDKLTAVVNGMLSGFLPTIFFLVINVIIVMFMDWKLGLIFLLPFIPAFLINLKIYKEFTPAWLEWEKRKEFATGLFTQSIINVQTVQNFVQEKREEGDFAQVRKGMENLDIDISTRVQKYFFAMGLLLEMSFWLTIIAGAFFVVLGQSMLGTVVYIVGTGSKTLEGIGNLFRSYTGIMRNLVAVVRMKELLDEKVDIKNSPNAAVPEEFQGNFRFEDVKFSYPQKDMNVLRNLNMRVSPGEMIAFVGASGAGKTTVTNLMCRMYDITGGSIFLDGHDIREFDVFWYRRLFAMVKQDVEIFDATLFENVAYPHPKSSREEVIEAMNAAHLEVMLEDENRFPEGISTQVGERGIRLSGGERQRVGIARAYLALLYGAKVLILDEATSSLDTEAERAIQKMINKLRDDKSISIVAIAHRLSTIRRADKIYVMDEGEIVEEGTHQELLKKDGLYLRYVKLQRLGVSETGYEA